MGLPGLPKFLKQQIQNHKNCTRLNAQEKRNSVKKKKKKVCVPIKYCCLVPTEETGCVVVGFALLRKGIFHTKWAVRKNCTLESVVNERNRKGVVLYSSPASAIPTAAALCRKPSSFYWKIQKSLSASLLTAVLRGWHLSLCKTGTCSVKISTPVKLPAPPLQLHWNQVWNDSERPDRCKNEKQNKQSRGLWKTSQPWQYLFHFLVLLYFLFFFPTPGEITQVPDNLPKLASLTRACSLREEKIMVVQEQ